MKDSKTIPKETGRQHGFTLIEVTLSMLVLTFGLLALGPLSTIVVRTNQISGRKSMAVILGQTRLEEYRRAGYAGLPAAGTTLTDYVFMSTSTQQMTVSTSNPGGLSYRRVTQVSTMGSPAIPHMRRVVVNVFWAGNLSVQLGTLVAQ